VPPLECVGQSAEATAFGLTVALPEDRFMVPWSFDSARSQRAVALHLPHSKERPFRGNPDCEIHSWSARALKKALNVAIYPCVKDGELRD
jgi:hypothetical protein